MSMRSILFALALVFGLNAATSALGGACATDKRVVAPCYQVHGRLSVCANMRLYLWPVGTQRLLAVSYAPDAPRADPPMPPNLAQAIGLDVDVFGDFRVCPFTPERPDKLRIVCIDSASHLIRRPQPRPSSPNSGAPQHP